MTVFSIPNNKISRKKKEGIFMKLEPKVQEIKTKIEQDVQIILKPYHSKNNIQKTTFKKQHSKNNIQNTITLSKLEQLTLSQQLMTYVKEFNSNSNIKEFNNDKNFFFITFMEKVVNVNSKRVIEITFYIHISKSHRTVGSITLLPQILLSPKI